MAQSSANATTPESGLPLRVLPRGVQVADILLRAQPARPHALSRAPHGGLQALTCSVTHPRISDERW
jgi:hypothetical protein